MTGAPASTAAQAADALRALPALATLGIGFMVIASDSTGAHHAYSVNLSAAAAAGLAEIAENTRARVNKATPISYGPAVLIPPSHVMHVAQSAAATLGAIQSVVEAADADAFDSGADYAKNATMVAARFATKDGKTVTFYRVADTLLHFTKSKVFSLIRRDGQYDRLEPADVLLMRAEFDVVVMNGHAFFFLKPTFERAFGFLQELKKASAATFDSVTSGLRITGLAELRAACTTQSQMMAKMASIRRSVDEDPTYAAAMTMPKLLAYVEANPVVNIEIEGTGANRSLVFNPAPATRFQIVKLLDDDYLRSVLTDRDYEAGSKIRAGHN
jgi:nucleotide-binding universal stress UspA family protein